MGKKKEFVQQTALAARDAAYAARDAANAAKAAVEFAESALTQVLAHAQDEDFENDENINAPHLVQRLNTAIPATEVSDGSNSAIPALRGSATSAPAVRPEPEPLPPSATSAQIAPPPKAKNPGIGRFVMLLGAIAAICFLAYKGYEYYTIGRFIVSTDDAYVKAETTLIASKIAGYVADLPVSENSFVHKGDVLAKLDDGDYVLALRDAEDHIGAQDATLARIDLQKAAQQALIDEANAQIPAAKEEEARARADLDRKIELEKQGFATRQVLDQSHADYQRALSGVKAAEAALAAAEANLSVLDGQKLEAERLRAELITARERTQRDLNFTQIRAPLDGVVGNKSAHVGDFVQPGLQLMVLVPQNSIYVEANFKETQLARMKIGQKVAIHIDALGGRELTGTVQSFAPASGSEFSLLPPDNATGNFTKIVQRVPVHIALSDDILKENLLRAGLSVVADVNTKPQEEETHKAGDGHTGNAFAEQHTP